MKRASVEVGIAVLALVALVVWLGYLLARRAADRGQVKTAEEAEAAVAEGIDTKEADRVSPLNEVDAPTQVKDTDVEDLVIRNQTKLKLG